MTSLPLENLLTLDTLDRIEVDRPQSSVTSYNKH